VKAPRAALVLELAGRRVLSLLAIACAASLALGVVELGVSAFLQLFLQSIGVMNPAMQPVGWMRGAHLSTAGVVAALLLIAFVRAVGQFTLNQCAVSALETTNARLRRLAVFDMLLHPSRRHVVAAAINAQISEAFPKASLCAYLASMCLSALLQSGLLALALVTTAPREAALGFLGLGVVGLGVLRVNRSVRKAAAGALPAQQELSVGIERVARNTTLVRVLRTERAEFDRLNGSVRAFLAVVLRAAALSHAAAALPTFAGVVLLAGLIVVSQRVLHSPGVTLLGFLYLFVRFVQSLAGAAGQFSQLNQYLPQLNAVLSYGETFTASERRAALEGALLAAESSAPVLAGEAQGAPPAIVLEGVTFAYPGAERAVLSDVAISVTAGEQFAVVGPSGGGKSTLLALMLGLFEPARGTVRIGGQTPREYFRNPAVRVGYVGAEAFLVAGSVRENLRYGARVQQTDDVLLEALAQARLREVVEALPGGLDYALREDGGGLSAGQKQRLCLARALANRPHVLVLDEASANLDVATEAELTEMLRGLRGQCTTVIVSHREGLLKYADRVLRVGELERQ